MKKQIKSVILMAIAALMVVSCGKSDLPGYKKTKDGLNYKIVTMDKNAKQVQLEDVLVAEVCLTFADDTLFNNFGQPDRVLRVNPASFKGDLTEGLLMLHEGDEAFFAVSADTMARFYGPNQMHPKYVAGQSQFFIYHIKVASIVSKEELEQEAKNYREQMEERKDKEPEEIAQYIADNNITAKPNQDGLYIIVKKKGNGPVVSEGKTVSMNYTGKLLDGSVFDSSEGREPFSYIVGKQGLIPGWETGVMGQPAGTQLQLIIPSALGYGATGAPGRIPPYSPLCFDIEILSVQ